ncbi:hypothetical protein [Bradyrhizobium sp. SZCCHNR3015]|uniref:hypothetical protein n=1 Tax=Bradyrhizobium sp. SZCCHNR3015 TaxID=3057395 RepID=UPI002916BCED|nr:hypothetical protein [Bradyrhizobium sp. SZCCHNR3015]
MPRFAIIDTVTNSVLTVIEYDEPPSNPPPGFSEGVIAVQNEDASADWTWDGHTLSAPPAAPAPVFVPQSASKLGLKRALGEIGRWNEAKALMASNAGVQEEWDLAIEIKRADPLAQIIIAAMSLSDADVDSILIRAAALV